MSKSGSSADQTTKGNKAGQDCSQEAPDRSKAYEWTRGTHATAKTGLDAAGGRELCGKLGLKGTGQLTR